MTVEFIPLAFAVLLIYSLSVNLEQAKVSGLKV